MAFRFTSKFTHQPSASSEADKVVREAIAGGELPFAALPYQDDTTVNGIESLARELRERFSAFVIVGIGGSDLGARAVHRVLNHQFYNLVSPKRLFFVGDTTDPLALQEVMGLVKWEETCVVVVSKSGNTIEVMSAYLVLREALKNAVGDFYKEHIVAVTDPESGTLRQVVQAEGYQSLAHPAVGGRFSVLSCVGLFPLALAGVDIRGLLSGAKYMLEEEPEAALEYAALQHAAYEKGQ
ncbi:MAG: hypothetical protein ACAH35_03200, partial [Candidatus Paceibacterota bacterium]